MDLVSSVNTFTSAFDDESANVILVDNFSNSISDSDLSETLNAINSSASFFFSPEPFVNSTSTPDLFEATVKNEVGYRDPLSIILPITICYLIIFVTGILGNVITCIVIAKNKTMHTATNYYLFNLAVSDFFVLIIGMPFDFMNIWLPNSYPFNETVCIMQGLFTETSTNATILTITSFTCERYIAICHPFRSHTMSKLSRVVRFIFAIWILAFVLAMPQAFQFGTVEAHQGVSCTVKNQFTEHAFEISSFLFFIVPMTVICVLYILIGIKLRQSKLLYGKKMKTCDSQRCIKGQSRVIRMLIAVVVTFFLCWAPFHAQRIMAVYGKIMKKSFSSDDLFMRVYIALTYFSGISYFLSTCINPFLYNIMSHKFRNASKLTLLVHCLSRNPSTKKTPLTNKYSALTLKIGAIESAGMTNRKNHYIIAPPSTSEINQIIGDQANANFACRADNGKQGLMNQSMVKLAASYEPANHSLSQNTMMSTLSRDNSVKIPKNKQVSANDFKPQKNDGTRSSFANKLFKCTQRVLIFKSDINTSVNENVTSPTKDVEPKLMKKNSNASIKREISNSSSKEIDEEEFTSNEITRMMFKLDKDINNELASTS